MVKALTVKQKRVNAGKSLRNMKYDTSFDQFCDLLASISKRAYLTFQKHFGGRGLRSMRYVNPDESLARYPHLHFVAKFGPNFLPSDLGFLLSTSAGRLKS
jgi:hypothetical protein